MNFKEPSEVLEPLFAIQAGVYSKTPVMESTAFNELENLMLEGFESPQDLLLRIENGGSKYVRLAQLIHQQRQHVAAFWQLAIVQYIFANEKMFLVGAGHGVYYGREMMSKTQRAHAKSSGKY